MLYYIAGVGRGEEEAEYLPNKVKPQDNCSRRDAMLEIGSVCVIETELDMILINSLIFVTR